MSFIEFLNRSLIYISVRFRGFFYHMFGIFKSKRQGKIYHGLRVRNGRNFKFLGDFKIGKNCRFETHELRDKQKPSVSIGANFSCGDNVHIGCMSKISVGEGVLLGSNIIIIDHNHGSPSEDLLNKTNQSPIKRACSSREITIGNNVWICDGVAITPGSIIKDGAIVGANSVVRGTVESYTIHK